MPVGRAGWRAAVLASIALLTVGCTRERSRPKDAACLADAPVALRLISTVPECGSGDLLCRVECRLGRAEACLAVAYSLDKEGSETGEAARLYRRACVLGVANGCTNHAAGIWGGNASDADLACARRTFEKACAVGEPFACGMVGRVMIESTTPPAYAEGRRYLEGACARVGGFSCRVLARHLESGKLGDYPPGAIRDLLRRACDGGDPNGCGDPATALETFD